MLIKGKKAQTRSVGIVSTSSTGLPKWRQSPIDLSKVFTWTKKFPPLLLTNYWSHKRTTTMTNTGRTGIFSILTVVDKIKWTVMIEFPNGTEMPYMKGGPLGNDEFQFMNAQFRWGPDNCYGCEHTVDGIWYSMEAQIMHWNTRYGSIEKCMDKSNGIAIFSCLMQVVGCPGIPDNPSLAPITDSLWKIKRAGTNTEISPDCLLWMLDACMGHGYYTYPGSLTTYPYNECAIWIIASTATKIATRQIDAFRGLYNAKSENILLNCREQQRPNRRIIYFATDQAVA